MCVELAMWPFGVLFYRNPYAAYISNFTGTMTLGEVLAKHLYDLFTFLVPVEMHGLPTKRKKNKVGCQQYSTLYRYSKVT